MNDTRDPRIGVTLARILTDEAFFGLDDAGKEAARLTTVTAISYSPKRKQYQVALRRADGKGVTGHLPASYVLGEPL